ncbi:MAG: HAD family hydrolase [Anaerotardibacter sp.]
MNQSKVTGLIFDCDGTILDSMPAWHSMEKELARRAEIPLTPALQDELNANTLEQTVSFFHEVGGLGVSFEELHKETLSLLARCYVSSRMKPGIAGFLREAAKRDIPMVVASSSPSSIIEIGLKSTGLLHFFKSIVSASDMHASKRNPEVIEEAFSRLGIETQNKGLSEEGVRKGVWGVEDSVYSLKIFSQQGFNTIGIYDSDIAGTFSQLTKTATVAVKSYDEINPELFFDRGF